MVLNNNTSLCMAPWTHTYLSPQTERRICCASREPAQNFKQYIDVSDGSGKYQPITLEQHWNSEHMRSVRKRMLAGEVLPECEVCNTKILNTDVYRSYFNQLFGHKLQDILSATDQDGYTTLQPVSWDYRFSNLCNFKCRMCGDMLSSSWEAELKQQDSIDYSNPNNIWMRPDVRAEISNFQTSTVEEEFAKAVEEHRVEEIYWVGGEPLMFEQHWKYMQRIIELGDADKVYARYNTNLSRIKYKDCDLYTDILSNLRDWQICASLDATGSIGEYIRTGLNYSQWKDNFAQGLKIVTNPRQMRLDLTLTLPGMFDLQNMVNLSNEFNVDILTKVCFAFDASILMSPLCLPKNILNTWIDDILKTINFNHKQKSLVDVLNQLKTRPTFEEQWPNLYLKEISKGKKRLLQLESIRPFPLTLNQILSNRKEVFDWWNSIP